MKSDYVFVNKNHRDNKLNSPHYLTFSKYLVKMYHDNGLMHDPLGPYKIPFSHTCFKVIDKGKAFIFCLNNGEQILKPEQSNKNFGKNE